MLDSNTKIVTEIISAQRSVMGRFASDLAHKVPGIIFDGETVVSVDGDTREVLKNLVNEYANLFGQSSIEVCKDVVTSLRGEVDENILPEELQAG